MTVSVESCFLVRSACHAIFCDTQGGFRWQPKQRTVARVPRYIQSLSKPTELFAAAPICLFIARLNFKCLLLSGCRGLSTLPRLSQVLSTLPWSSLGVPLALPWGGVGRGREWVGSPPRPSSVFLDDRTNSGGCLGGVMDPTELTHLGGKLAIPGRMGDGPLCGLCGMPMRSLCRLCVVSVSSL